MDTKHNDDTLKTMREPLKERDEQPPSTPQPKKTMNLSKNDIQFLIDELTDLINTGEQFGYIEWEISKEYLEKYKEILNKLKSQ